MPAWQRDVAVSYNLVGNVLVDAARAARSAQVLPRGARLSCSVLVQQASRSNAQWQNDLQFCIGRIGLAAWNAVLAQRFCAMAMDAADQAIALAPQATWLYASRAHALMLLGRVDGGADALSQVSRGEERAWPGKSWDAVVLEGFAALKKAGLTSPLMDEIERQFSSAG